MRALVARADSSHQSPCLTWLQVHVPLDKLSAGRPSRLHSCQRCTLATSVSGDCPRGSGRRYSLAAARGPGGNKEGPHWEKPSKATRVLRGGISADVGISTDGRSPACPDGGISAGRNEKCGGSPARPDGGISAGRNDTERPSAAARSKFLGGCDPTRGDGGLSAGACIEARPPEELSHVEVSAESPYQVAAGKACAVEESERNEECSFL